VDVLGTSCSGGGIQARLPHIVSAAAVAAAAVPAITAAAVAAELMQLNVLLTAGVSQQQEQLLCTGYLWGSTWCGGVVLCQVHECTVKEAKYACSFVNTTKVTLHVRTHADTF
jgi:hypothetical protein